MVKNGKKKKTQEEVYVHNCLKIVKWFKMVQNGLKKLLKLQNGQVFPKMVP